MKLAILIVFYDTLPATSSTLQSIINADTSSLDNIVLHLWNNGPAAYSETEIKKLSTALASKNISSYLYNGGDNTSLAAIYNYFIAQPGSTHLIIFDQDSTVQKDFFTKLSNIKQGDIIFPIVFEQNTPKYYSPVIAYSKQNVTSVTKEGKHQTGDVFCQFRTMLILPFCTSFFATHLPDF